MNIWQEALLVTLNAEHIIVIFQVLMVGNSDFQYNI